MNTVFFDRIHWVEMSQLYVGNLPTDIDEISLRQLFSDNYLSCGDILIKKGGYAFVDCRDQTMADKAIDKLNGYYYSGVRLVVEPTLVGVPGNRGIGPDKPDNQMISS